VKACFVLLIVAMTGVSVASLASSDIGTAGSLGSSLVNAEQGLGESTSSSLASAKVVLQAREDAARFVGTDGAVRGVSLEAALVHIRAERSELEATDMQLAKAILAL
tara:strand:- start:127620 stop:127940 length:321 start_codon:yes stop_codon:yes gene_type:complete